VTPAVIREGCNFGRIPVEALMAGHISAIGILYGNESGSMEMKVGAKRGKKTTKCALISGRGDKSWPISRIFHVFFISVSRRLIGLGITFILWWRACILRPTLF
jgi:hypothetical protein